MKRICIALALAILVASCSTSNADFRCRGRHIVSPCFTPCHEVVHETVHHAAIITPTITTIVQEPLPVFVFQNLSGYPSMPASVTQPQPASFPSQQFQAPQQQHGLQLSDAQMDRIATMVVQKLAGSSALANTALMIPKIEETPDARVEMSQAIVDDLGAKCSSCHMAGTSTKGGLAIFDANRQFSPTKNGAAYSTPEKLWQRAQTGEMPPAATTDVSKRLNPDTIAFLRSAVGQ